jgi:hypothetical protein
VEENLAMRSLKIVRRGPKVLLYVLTGALVLGALSTLVVALGQGQDRPGQISQARVWIENRTKEDAIAVSIQDVASGNPMRVQIAGTPSVALAPSSLVETRAGRQQWDYRTLNVPSGQDPSLTLQSAGADSWETTAVPGARRHRDRAQTAPLIAVHAGTRKVVR